MDRGTGIAPAPRPHRPAMSRHRAIRHLGSALFVGVAILWVVLLRPVGLGGPASYIVVSGSSMEPGLRTGDLVIVVQQDAYALGQIVAFRVDSAIVLHRIVGGSGASGFVVRGDNRTQPDLWKPLPAEILGAAQLHLPGIGRLTAQLRQPLILGLLFGTIAFALVWSSGRPGRTHGGVRA